jgi:hypothetical protein
VDALALFHKKFRTVENLWLPARILVAGSVIGA